MNTQEIRTEVPFPDDLLALAIQEDERYQRRLNGAYESVNYEPNSSLRFFVNHVADCYATHWHQATELVMPLENGYQVTIRDDRYELRPGDILIIPSGELHSLSAPPEGIRLIYMFELSVLSKIQGFSYLTALLSRPVLITPENSAPIYENEAGLMQELLRTWLCENNLRDLSVYALLIRFFVNYSHYRITAAVNIDCEDDLTNLPHPEHRKTLLDTMNTVFDYLEGHFSENITLEQIAGVAGYSRYHFSRLFKQYSGYNFYDYLIRRKIRAAENLLTDPNLAVTEVALRSGFSSLSSFNRSFRKIRNCTPSEYRSLYQDTI